MLGYDVFWSDVDIYFFLYARSLPSHVFKKCNFVCQEPS